MIGHLILNPMKLLSKSGLRRTFVTDSHQFKVWEESIVICEERFVGVLLMANGQMVFST